MDPKDIFDYLDRWRHLPDYQLERRADIIFALYLPETCKEYCKFDARVIIPEFPIRYGSLTEATVPPKYSTDMFKNRSGKIDYLILPEQNSVPHPGIFLELKTDDRSRDAGQDQLMRWAQQTGLQKLVGGVIILYGATSAKAKYLRLLNLLKEASLVATDPKKGYVPTVSEGHQPGKWYLQPNPPQNETNTISFEQVAKVVDRHSDDFSKRFAVSLRRWAASPAGTG